MSPKLVSGLKQLRRLLAPLETCPPDEITAQLMAQHVPFTLACQDLVPLDSVTQPELTTALRLLVSEGTVTQLIPTILRRLHMPSPNTTPTSTATAATSSSTTTTTSPSPPPPLTAAMGTQTLPGAYLLAAAVAPFVSVALDRVKTPEAMAAGAAFIQALAKARICDALAGVLAAARAAALSSSSSSSSGGSSRSSSAVVAAVAEAGDSSDHHKQLAFLGSVAVGCGSLGLLLLQHALLHEPASAALREDLTASRLLQEACDAMTHLLAGQYGPDGTTAAPVPVVETAELLAAAFTVCAAADQATADGTPAAAAAWVRSARCATLQAAMVEPAFARLTLAALSHFRPGPPSPADEAAGCTAENQVILLQALTLWLAMAECEGPDVGGRLIAGAGVTAAVVEALALASGGCSGEVTAAAVRRTYLLLSPEDQLRAYAGVAGHAGQLLERLAEWYRTGGKSNVFARGNLAAFAAHLNPGQCSALAVELFAAPISGVQGQEQRARCVLQLDLVNKTEALLRARVTPPASGQRRSTGQRRADDAIQHNYVAHDACQAAAGAAIPLMVAAAEEAPRALAAYLSLIATARKVVARQAQEMDASGASYTGGNQVGGIPQHFQPCMALRIMLASSPLHAVLVAPPLAGNAPSCATVATAARMAVRCTALQLLPPLVQGLTLGWLPAAQASRAPTEAEVAGTIHSLRQLHLLHPSGVSDISLAAGVPGLLLALLRSQRAQGVGTTPHASMFVVEAALNVAATAAGSEPWLREAERLGLGEELAVWTQAGPRLRAAAQGKAEALRVVDLVLVSAALLSSKCKALPSADTAAVVPTWDSCALEAVSEASAAGLAPFLGCWHRGCTDLEGSCEAALKLLLCNNCRIARYCCAACQKQAWAAGHRAACNAWKAAQAAVAGATAPAAAPPSAV